MVGFPPQIIHFNRRLYYKLHPFWGFSLFFENTHAEEAVVGRKCWKLEVFLLRSVMMLEADMLRRHIRFAPTYKECLRKSMNFPWHIPTEQRTVCGMIRILT